MKLTKRILLTSLLGQLVLALAGAALLYFGMMSSFDTDIRHFTGLWPFVGCLGIVIGAGLVLAVVMTVLFRKAELFRTPSSDSVFFVFTAALAGALFLVSAVTDWRDADAIAQAIPTSTSATFAFLLHAKAVLAVPAAVFCILAVVGAFVKKLSAVALRISGMLFMLWAVLSALATYFSSTEAINSPVKSLVLLLGVTLMLFTAGECRIRFERPGAARLMLYFLPMIAVGGTVGLTSLLLSFTDATLFGLSLVSSALYTSLWLMAVARFVTLLSACAPKDNG